MIHNPYFFRTKPIIVLVISILVVPRQTQGEDKYETMPASYIRSSETSTGINITQVRLGEEEVLEVGTSMIVRSKILLLNDQYIV